MNTTINQNQIRDLEDILNTKLDTNKVIQDLNGGSNNVPSVSAVNSGLNLKQDLSNIVTSFQVTPDNTHYPSEKLVKDNLDLKQNISNIVTSFQINPDNTHYPSEKLLKDSLDLKQTLPNTVVDSSSTAPTLNLAANTNYFLGTLTALTISSVEDSPLETVIYFTTGNTFTFTALSLNNYWVGFSGTPDFELNTKYVIAIKNSIACIGIIGAD